MKEMERDSQLMSPKENDFISGNGWEMCSHCEDITQLSSKMMVLWISCQTFKKSESAKHR